MSVKNNLGTSFHFDNLFENKLMPFRLFDLFQIGEICCEREYEIPFHVQPCDEISYILSGKGIFYINSTPFPVKSGDVILNRTGETHFIRSDQEQKLRFAYIGYHLHPSASEKQWRAVQQHLHNIPKQIVPDHEGLSLYFPRAVREFYDKTFENHLLFERLAEELILLTYRDFVREQAEIPLLDAKESATEETVYRIMCYIEHHVDSLTGTREIAKQMGYSEAYLSRLFHQKTGMTLQRYISEIRIARAIELMKLGEYTLSAIADMLQYQTPQAFSRAFRRIVGMSAREYSGNNFKGYDPEQLPTISEQSPHKAATLSIFASNKKQR